jgi:hypothetical protein
MSANTKNPLVREHEAIGMRTRATGLMLLFALMGIVSACGVTQSEPPRTEPAAGELTATRIDVHEAPG